MSIECKRNSWPLNVLYAAVDFIFIISYVYIKATVCMYYIWMAATFHFKCVLQYKRQAFLNLGQRQSTAPSLLNEG